MITPRALWAKLERDEAGRVVRWHTLVDHSADVAAVTEALLRQPTWRRRLAQTAGRAELDDITIDRLAALSFLHDIGKANRGFRARIDPDAPPVGHIDQLAWVFHGGRFAEDIQDHLIEVLGFDRLVGWFAGEPLDFLAILFAHHGRPWDAEAPDCRKLWEKRSDSDPVAELAPMRAALDRWFAPAFADGPPLPDAPAFQHAFAGLLMLADWLGSDVRAFPLANGADPDRMSFARSRAPEMLRAIGIEAEGGRTALRRRGALDFAATFGLSSPRPVQEGVTEPDANLLVVEAETGSGKTEAALWRFASLFERGAVDGLYFALPTRVAATQIFRRVNEFRDRLFAGVGEKPVVVLAVPGQLRVGEAEGRLLPGFKVEWNDGPEDAEAKRLARWAAERPKRYLAAPISVGTVDQALLGAIQVKHAHLRGTALLRHLLVVDEVHASDRYMETLLTELLRAHVQTGGHALLLSATLGAGMRARLLGAEIPSFEAAAALPYPAMTWAEGGRERRRAVATTAEPAAGKQVALEPRPLIDDSDAVAALALAAARDGAKVLVLRNTVKAAVKVAQACESLAGAERALLFRAEGVATLHHARFAPEDRVLLDRAVEAQIGRDRPEGGLVLVGTQTLEISLDLDADLLVTDLCPVDVLLQRIGRLHRHVGRARPVGFGAPRALVLTPRERSLETLAKRARHGLGLGVYDDLRIIEATWRLLEAEPVWTIPEMNRRLVESATHPERLAAIEHGLAAGSEAWRRHFDEGEGKQIATLFAAQHAKLDRAKPFDHFRPDPEERLATRLGAKDRHVSFEPAPMGPFGRPITSVRIPHHMLEGTGEDDLPCQVVDNSGSLSFRLGGAVFVYDRFGLDRVARA